MLASISSMRRLVRWILLIFLLTRIVGADESEPTKSDWRLEQTCLPEEGIFEGEQVLSIDLDIDGDGTPERLITLQDAYRNGKEGNLFSVFRKEGKSFRSLGEIQFDPRTARLLQDPNQPTRERLYFIRYLDDGEGLLRHYEITSNGTFEAREDKVLVSTVEARFSEVPPLEFNQMPAIDLYHRYSPAELAGILIDPEANVPNRPDRRSKRDTDPPSDQADDRHAPAKTEADYHRRFLPFRHAGMLIFPLLLVAFLGRRWLKRSR